MSRINTNVQSIIAQRVLTKQNGDLSLTLQRLSTGFKINTGKDDPAGLIASETMRAEMRAIQAAQGNVSRAMNVVAVAESGLNEINRLLNDIEDLVDRSSNETGISEEERIANQQEIDLILQSINRIANTSELQGRKLLSGELSYDTSSVNAAEIAYLRLNSVRVPDGGTREVNIDVLTGASLAIETYTGGNLTATPVTIEVTGNLGSERLSFASATSAEIVQAIQQSATMTGVSAANSTAGVQIFSTEYGSAQFVKIRVLDDAGGQWTMSGTGTDYGNDVIASVNGQIITGEGLNLRPRTAVLDADVTLAAAFGSVATGGTSTFGVTGGGALFQISPTLNLNGQATLGIDSLSTASLGEANIGWLYEISSGEQYDMSTSRYFTAQRIVRRALQQVATLRGRLGSFHKNILQTASNALAIQYEKVAAAESVLRDTDFAQETSNLTRSQILVQSATNVLRIANAQPQQVLSLLG